MNRDEFFGTHIASRQIGEFTLSLRAYREGTQLPPHTHSRPFATVVVNGGFREESGGNIVDCLTHDIVVHAPGERHRNHFIGRRTRCLSVQGGSFTRTACIASTAAASIAVKLLGEFRRADALSPLAIDALMQELFVEGERQYGPLRRPRWLAEVHRRIASEFQRPLTLMRLAASVDVHPGHLARAFRREYGVSVGECVREQRVAYARQRLQSSDALRTIAHDAGFADQSHFTRTFRLATGLTPARYRRALRSF